MQPRDAARKDTPDRPAPVPEGGGRAGDPQSARGPAPGQPVPHFEPLPGAADVDDEAEMGGQTQNDMEQMGGDPPGPSGSGV